MSRATLRPHSHSHVGAVTHSYGGLAAIGYHESCQHYSTEPGSRTMSAHPVLPGEESVLATVDADDLYKSNGTIKRKYYERGWTGSRRNSCGSRCGCASRGLRAVVLFDGRDAAGKGGTIHRITRRTSSRVVKVVALGKPTEREQTQWYFQRYVEHLPAAGEVVLFDRSWYNRATVERVMGFCTDAEYEEFLRSAPEFERMLQRSGIVLVKYWFSISDEEQERRFQKRSQDPKRRWKLSPMDLEARNRWVDYSRAKDAMFEHTDTDDSPWYVVDAEVKKHARLNCITHLLGRIDYEDTMPEPAPLPPRESGADYERPPIDSQRWVPAVYGSNPTDAGG